MPARIFRDGDKAVVESPVFIVGADTVTPHYLSHAPKVGDVVTVVEADAFGPKEVGTSTGFRMAVEGLIHLDDIDALAKERAPETVIGTATVVVNARVFIGSVDITTLLDEHALKALVSARVKEASA